VIDECAALQDDRGLIGEKQYALMKPNAYFVTTARGNIHDEVALEAALRAKKIAGAGLDVWEKEPPPLDHPLLKYDNVMVSPHTAGVTREARVNMGRIAAEQMLAALDGRPVARVLNPEVWPRYAARFIEHWQPNLALLAESDLWPNLIMACTEKGIPLILVNGRLSERSFTRWRYLPNTIGALLSRFDLCLTQSEPDAERYSELGAPRVSMTGNLKLDVPAPPVDAGKLAAMRAVVRQRPVIAAASTHPGEEAVIIDAVRRLRQSFPGLLTIIAPRHPERGSGVVEIATAAGLNAVARSRGLLPDRGTDVYVADTIGELGLIYRLAPIVFMGGSLVRHGGQNPIEAAKLGAAILHGPHVWNFTEIYAALDEAHGAEEVLDVSKLALRIGSWLTDAALRKRVADAGLATVDQLGGALRRTLSAIEPYLMQLDLERR